jgi:hypothetical protein
VRHPFDFILSLDGNSGVDAHNASQRERMRCTAKNLSANSPTQERLRTTQAKGGRYTS